MSGENERTNSATQVSARMKMAGVAPNRIVIEKFKECIFHEDKVVSFRGVVQTINGQMYVGLSKFWFVDQERGWIPTKKHFYMTPEVWKKFAQITHGLTEACNAATRAMNNPAQQQTINGMSYICSLWNS